MFSAAGVNEYTGTCWIIKSGATSHSCSDQRLFVELERLEQPLNVALGDGQVLQANHRGPVHLHLKSDSLTRRYKLHNVLFVPQFTYC